MESVGLENSKTALDENPDERGPASAENFQKFMCELFEKNGVMNDLRSYLRGHIVNVLRSSQTGDPPACQKHFTQRLDLTFQAMNILIAEYLLRLEFNYTLSVFVSEIPLANMVFSFAKTLMEQVDIDDSRPRFKDCDVWCILNYLGVKCDSEHASSIVEMYRLEPNAPLLLCILKTAPLFKEPVVIDQEISSQESLSSSNKSSGSTDKLNSPKTFQETCRHYVFCKTCQSKMMKIKEKYRRKRKEIAKKITESCIDSVKVESLMKSVNVMEKSLIDEMFGQLKSVYEAEMEQMKEEEDKRVKRSVATYSTQLLRKREEMEESFKAREAELQSSVQQKKRFLWGLARALREQHQHMTRAMRDVRAETDRLSAKEDSLKSQLAEAEQILKQRGEDMRQQISGELLILEGHLESMKKERESINRERAQLEQYKDSPRIHNENLKSHYDLLNNELVILKKYLEKARVEPKCVIERATLTDLNDITTKIDVVLNNGQDAGAGRSDEKVKTRHLVNDFKKQKNVNFSQSNLDEIYRERSQSRSRSSASSEAGDAQFHTEYNELHGLRDENQHLRDLTRQQREHINSLSTQQARLQAELTASRIQATPAPTPTPAFNPLPPAVNTLHPYQRPQTAPNPPLFHAVHPQGQGLSTSASVNRFSFGWRKGAGEELSFFSNAQPRIVLPGDRIPFIGPVTRHSDNRRYLINQWRSLRRRFSPLAAAGGVRKPRVMTVQRNYWETLASESAGPSVTIQLQQVENVDINTGNSYAPEVFNRPKTPKTREKSPKSVLREAKEKLRNKDSFKDNIPTTRPKSPNSVLREAKLRLRKLEIEAEAVEKSYLDFRRKQNHFRGIASKPEVMELDTKPSTSTYKLNETNTKQTLNEPSTNEYDRYYKEYQKLDQGIQLKNKNTAAVRINPIPNAYSDKPEKSENYLDTSLAEFRKLYNSERLSNDTIEARPQSTPDSDTSKKGTRKEIIRQAKNDKAKELELLKHNIEKIYNMPVQAMIETPTNESNNEIDVELKTSISVNEEKNNENGVEEKIVSNTEDRNLLRIEVESMSEVNDVVTDCQTQELLLVVESSIDNRDEVETNKISTQMTIIVSPKRSTFKGQLSESLTQNGSVSDGNSRLNSVSVKSEKISKDYFVYHSDKERVSSVEMQLDLSKDILENTSVLEQNEDPDYPDDFSVGADVDNYNSRSEVLSPISLPKTSEDENFWDS